MIKKTENSLYRTVHGQLLEQLRKQRPITIITPQGRSRRCVVRNMGQRVLHSIRGVWGWIDCLNYYGDVR